MELADIYFTEKTVDVDKIQAANFGDVAAMNNFGELYRDGEGVNKDLHSSKIQSENYLDLR